MKCPIYKKPKTSYGGNCDCCGGIAEEYMLTASTWGAAKLNDERFLCIECVEIRLGNTLRESSFIDAPINHGCFGFVTKDYLKWKKIHRNLD